MTLYLANGKKRQLSIAGKTLEDYEWRVARKLGAVYAVNRTARTDNPEAYNKLVDSIFRFQKTVKTDNAKEELDFLFKWVKSDNKKGGENT